MVDPYVQSFLYSFKLVHDISEVTLFTAEKKKTPPRRGQTYTLDDTGKPLRPLNRPKITEKPPVKLPALGPGNSTQLTKAAGYVSGDRRRSQERRVKFQTNSDEVKRRRLALAGNT